MTGRPPTPPARRALPGRRAVLAGLAGVAPLVVAGCALIGEAAKPGKTAGVQEPDPGRAAFVMIIRHGEKPDGSHPGLDEAGRPDGKSLTRRGWERAEALPTLFSPPVPGLQVPARILAAADVGPHAGAHRMRQTVGPLARALGLTVNTGYAETQESALAGAVLADSARPTSDTGEAQPVLICWEHSRIPRIVEALGAAHTGVPAEWPDRFDTIWTFSRPAGGAWAFHEVRQHLLDGDT
ncbi:hypothetical protein ACIRD3_06720 [Kitasatospora sp. NPDC093550]|uniref:hypothetical protein n=1 Tax=Kitasatospora sp. NPDC093550 TaxID=3364089 RepID=UPI0037FC432E